MSAASILIKPCSSNCNIDCSYCFYKKLCRTRAEYSKGRMTQETLETLIANACEYAKEFISFAFQGGEPMLAGLDFYREVVRLQDQYRRPGQIIENTIQTNGVLIDAEWAAFFAAHDFLVGVSLDGPRKLHDACRVDAAGAPTFGRVMDGIGLLKSHGVRFNIATVVTQALTAQAAYLYKFYKRNAFPYVQLIPCMGDSWAHDGSCDAAENEFSVRPAAYGAFLCEMFDLWYDDFCAGDDMEIRMFSNLAQLAAGYPAEECGMNGCCSCYFVTEADGSVYPCDFYCTDNYCLGTVSQPFAELIQSPKVTDFIRASVQKADACVQCPYYRLCRGGCRHWRDGNTQKNYLCEGYRIFFAHCADRIQTLGNMILAKKHSTV